MDVKTSIVDLVTRDTDLPDDMRIFGGEMKVAREVVELLANAGLQIYRAEAVLGFCKMAIIRGLITANVTVEE